MKKSIQFLDRYGAPLCEAAILAAILLFSLSFLQPSLLVLDTMTVGGDTPAHNYLASHLSDQLFHHGRIVSWAGGWWCGFPMFQFYFCLPYLLISLLSVLIPFNIAFKIVSVLGILVLPSAVWASARMMRFPRPVPILLAIAMLPFLFVTSHTMWGVNVYSTLAGMISNSISFPLMILFLACAYRDSEDGEFRLRTVLVLVALIASHFFTSIVAALTILLFPFLRPARGIWRSIGVLAAEGALALLLMAWWLIPLMAKQEFTADFGTSWNVSLPNTLPDYIKWLALSGGLIAIGFAVARGIKAVWVFVWMLLVSVALFYGGPILSPVFVNIRLWPFLFFALLALGVCGIGLLVARLRAPEIVSLAVLAVAIGYVGSTAGDVESWAAWNYEGLQAKTVWPAFQQLILPLKGTPGRLANDLSPENNALGSSRIFECVPHLTGKPILEGGIVNSALGSLFSYYIQSETSQNCAGYPNEVTPATFDLTNATRHLALFNIKHFIARWPVLQQAMSQSPDWRLVDQAQGWQLYELTSNDGRYVVIPSRYPMALRTDRRKECGLLWLYCTGALDQPFALLPEDGRILDASLGPVVSKAQFSRFLLSTSQPGTHVFERLGRDPAGASATIPAPLPGIDASRFRIRELEVSDNRIAFTTDGVGLPHIIKCSYYPNWRVKGARAVYMVTPGFMLVYPERTEVELYYGLTQSDVVGRVLAALGAVLLLAAVCARRRRGPSGPGVFNRVAVMKILDATMGFTLCWVFGYLRFLFSRRQITSEFHGQQSRRILVIRPGGMGDMILLLPVIRRIQREFPGVAIDLVCERRNIEVLRLAGLADLAVAYDSHPLRLLWMLFSRKYDAAVDTEQFHNFSAIIAFLSGAELRIGFKINPTRNLLYTHLINYAMDGYEGQQFMRLLAPLGVAASDYRLEGILADMDWRPSSSAAGKIEALQRRGPFVAYAPGSRTPYKRWDVSKSIDVVQWLGEKKGLGVALVGGGDHSEDSRAIMRYAGARPAPVESFAGTLSLADSAALLKRARLFVGGDSGLAHLAIALGLPTVVIFGPSDSLKWGLKDSRHDVIQKRLACSPCFIFGYHRPCRTIACMAEVSAGDVIAACEGLLEGSSASQPSRG